MRIQWVQGPPERAPTRLDERSPRQVRIDDAFVHHAVQPRDTAPHQSRCVSTHTVTVRWPDDFARPFGDTFLPEHLVREKLLASLAERVARLYCEHEPDSEFGARD